MIYFCSDLHFNHENILKYEPETRPFETVEEMNEILIKNWNSVVTSEDTVYVLGDFFMGKIDKIPEILNRLNRKEIILIPGNHDTKNRLAAYKEFGITVKDSLLDHIRYKGLNFMLCHFPIENQELFNMMTVNNGECILLYGHIHSNAPKGFYQNTYHIGVDTNNLTPVSAEQIWKESYPEALS